MSDGLLYRSLIKQVRALDANGGRDLLKRYLAGAQQVADDTAARIQALKDTDRPETCRADLLQHMLWTVGLTPDYSSLYSNLNETMLRKLIRLAVPMWRKRGTEEGLANVIRLLTGRSMVYKSWFRARSLLGETYIGDEDAGSIVNGGEYDSTVYLVDGGTLDAQLAADIISLFRPANETINVIILAFLDLFDGQTLDKWTTANSSGADYLDTMWKVLHLEGNGSVKPTIPTLPARTASHTFQFKHRFVVTDAASTNDLFLRINMAGGISDPHYYVLIRWPAGDSTKNTTWVNSVAAGGAMTDIIPNNTVLPVLLDKNDWHTIRVEVDVFHPNISAQPSTAEVRVYVDNDLAVSFQHNQGINAFYGGGFMIGHTILNGYMEVDAVQYAYRPLRTASIGPTGTTYSDSFIKGYP